MRLADKQTHLAAIERAIGALSPVALCVYLRRHPKHPLYRSVFNKPPKAAAEYHYIENARALILECRVTVFAHPREGTVTARVYYAKARPPGRYCSVEKVEPDDRESNSESLYKNMTARLGDALHLRLYETGACARWGWWRDALSVLGFLPATSTKRRTGR